MKTAVAALLAVGLFSGTASARTIFDHIRDFAPKSNFDAHVDNLLSVEASTSFHFT